MKNRIISFSIVVSVIIAFVYFLSLVVNTNGENTIKLVKSTTHQKIKIAKLIGASPDDVITFLNKEHITHAEYYRVYPFNPNLNRTIRAMRPMVARTWRWPDMPYSINVTITFYFDQNDICQRYVIDEIPQT